jgi:hypothetical protein
MDRNITFFLIMMMEILGVVGVMVVCAWGFYNLDNGIGLFVLGLVAILGLTNAKISIKDKE